MKIWITRPKLPRHPLEDKILQSWAGFHQDITLIEPASPYEIHGELLTRIWNEIRQDPDPVHLISESDFWVNAAEAKHELARWQRLERAAFFCELVQHSDHPNYVRRAPLVGPWFMAFNLKNFRKEVPLNWLGASGPFNDAANCAYMRGVEAGAFFEGDVQMNRHHMTARHRGTQYDFGAHFFWRRHWDEPTRVIYERPTYTIAEHLKAIEAFLQKPT